MKTCSALTAILSLAAGAAVAQQSDLSADDARAFLEPLASEAEQAVSDGNWKGIQSWMAEHVADEAPIHFTGNVLASQGPSMTFTGSMKGSDLERFAKMSMGSPMMDVIEDYTLELNIMDTWALPNGQVAAAVAFYEYGALDMSAMKDGGTSSGDAQSSDASSDATQSSNSGGDMEGAMESGVFSSATTCALRMGGTADNVTIELANCKIDANL